ncbi:hypothetical protein LCGC14_3032520, partial [marine sediment metagenome]
METTLTTYEVRYYLAILGYSDGKYPDDPPAADPTNPKYRRQIEAFQADYRELAGNPDGIYGPKTESAMLPLIKQIVAVDGWRVPAAPPETTAPAEKPAYKDMGDLRRWRLTEYWISDAVEGDIPIQDQHGNAIASVSEHSYISAALEGTIYGPDKSLINVAFRPQKLNLLLGMNNAGKTNLSQALTFLATTSSMPLGGCAFTGSGPYEIRNVYFDKPTIDFHVTASVPYEREDLKFHYELT